MFGTAPSVPYAKCAAVMMNISMHTGSPLLQLILVFAASMFENAVAFNGSPNVTAA